MGSTGRGRPGLRRSAKRTAANSATWLCYDVMTTYSYRQATDEDVSVVTDVYNEAIVEGGSTTDLVPVGYEERNAWIDKHRDPYAVFVITATDEDGTRRDVGFAAISAFYHRPGYDGVCSLAYYIADDARGRGAGSFAMRMLLDECAARGMRRACTTIFADNSASTGLCERFGFTRYGWMPDVAYDSRHTLHGMSYWYIDL